MDNMKLKGEFGHNLWINWFDNFSSERRCLLKPWRIWAKLALCRLSLKKVSVIKMLLILFVLVTVLIINFGLNSSHRSFVRMLRNKPPVSAFYCENKLVSKPNEHRISGNASLGKLRDMPRVLLLTETQYSKLGKSLAEVLVANRIKYKMEVIGKSLPQMTNLSRGKYGVVIVENFLKYLTMDQWNRELLDKYLVAYGVGLIGYVPYAEMDGQKLPQLPLSVGNKFSLKNYTLNADSPVLRITRPGDHISELSVKNWTVFYPEHRTFTPLAWGFDAASHNSNDYHVTAIVDNGQLDGVRRVLFGMDLEFWLNRLLLLDAISYLSFGKISLSLEHYVLVDIDDIFVAPKGYRMTFDDVEHFLSGLIEGFRFNLGFSGKYFHHGYSEENAGDDRLLYYVDKFWWFGHMWGHTQPHKFMSQEELENQMLLNKIFAKEHGIPTDSGYSVAPHHSGVYPVHEPLYEAWKRVWNVRVTSTEEYPHLRPSRLRRGFVHRNVMVLPRQTCGLYTHTVFMDRYPGGKEALDRSIFGGDIFQTVINDPISIFMTHLSNYGNDRLALYAFESLFKFVKCWTNLKLTCLHPSLLGEKYFQIFPDEVDPLWENPCNDHRHMEIWSKNKTCDRLPNFLVIGPQKTGTTALYTFLLMHPMLAANQPSPETFEEVQFFNGRNYYKGIDWYMKFFPNNRNHSLLLFEKSATYFDGEIIPKRVKALIPHAKLITILIPPGRRAYSWYQHMRAHNDAVALTHSFMDIISAKESDAKLLKDLRNRCLSPGMYAKHIERWLDYFPASQLLIIDGEELRNDPIKILNDVQKFLSVAIYFNYTEHIRFDKRKGFYCQVVEKDKTKCLGRGKGRQYLPFGNEEEKILKNVYREHNIALEKLLTKLGYAVPKWVIDDLS